MKMVALRCGGFNNVDVERFGGEWLERGVEGPRLQRRRPTSWASPSPGRARAGVCAAARIVGGKPLGSGLDLALAFFGFFCRPVKGPCVLGLRLR